MGVFDIVGPVMIGPSSSHTAGAARLGRMARNILGDTPVEAVIKLYGSFAQTYKGHGTDKALTAGILGFSAEDERIKHSLEIAADTGVKVVFQIADSGAEHPNTAEITIKNQSGDLVTVVGISIGGGDIAITKINQYAVYITGRQFTLLIANQDIPGVIAEVTRILAYEKLNIAFMRVSRSKRGADALMILDLDQPVPEHALRAIREVPAIERALLLHPL